jgi:hypothetical protein
MLYGAFGRRRNSMLFGMTYLFWFFMLVLVAIGVGLTVVWLEKWQD